MGRDSAALQGGRPLTAQPVAACPTVAGARAPVEALVVADLRQLRKRLGSRAA